MSKSTKSAPKFIRTAEVRASSYVEADNTIEVVWTTGAAVRRFDWQTGEPYQEILEVTPSAVRLDRLNAGAPLLDTHDSGSVRSVIGSVVPGSARIESGQGLALVRLSDSPDDASAVGKIRSGIVRNVSVGYRVLRVRKTEHENADTEWRVVDWEPLEISAVPVPADAGAQFRADNDDAAPVEFIEDEPDAEEIRTETLRVGTIAQLTARSSLPPEFGQEHIRAGTPVAAFRDALLDELVKREAPATDNRAPARVGTEHAEKRAEVMVAALLHRMNPHSQISEGAREYRGFTLIDMAREALELRGVKTRGMTREEIVAHATERRSGGYGSTSDFPVILGNAANTTLRAAYEAAPQTFRPFTRQVTVPDFKDVVRVQLGEGPAFDKVNEHGEFKRGSVGEASEKYRIYSYGKIVGLTRQAIINDSFDAFGRLHNEFGKAAAQLESDLVWAQILGNPTMADGTNLFHANHGNLAGSAVPLSSPSAVAAIAAGMVAMAKQRGLDGRTTLNIRPAFLITGQDSADAAETILSAALRATDSVSAVPERIRKLQLITDHRIDLGITRPDIGANIAGAGDAWWLAAAPTWLDTVELAYLAGSPGVRSDVAYGFDVDGVEFKSWLDVGAKAIDWRGFYRGN